jgi:type IV pilus assembly protein PilF
MLKIVLSVLCFLILSGCITVKPNDEISEEKKISTAKINVQLGMAYLARQDVERAKQKLLLAISQAPKAPETWYSFAYFLEKTNNASDAKKNYLKALHLAPKRGDTNNNYGTFLCRQGDYVNAIKYFMIASKDPNYLETASAYENAGLCSLKIPNKQIAKLYFKKAIAYDPTRTISLAELKKLKTSSKG